MNHGRTDAGGKVSPVGGFLIHGLSHSWIQSGSHLHGRNALGFDPRDIEMIAKIPALFFMLLFAATAHAQQERVDPLQFEALRFGMSLDEARKASPETQWTVVGRQPETERAYAIRGERAVTLAGMEFDLEIGARGLGTRSWILESNAMTR